MAKKLEEMTIQQLKLYVDNRIDRLKFDAKYLKKSFKDLSKGRLNEQEKNNFFEFMRSFK